MKWTEAEQRLVSVYGCCVRCRAPRDIDYKITDGDRVLILFCTADPTHSQH